MKLDEKYRAPYFQTLRELVAIPSRSSPTGGEEERIQLQTRAFGIGSPIDLLAQSGGKILLLGVGLEKTRRDSRRAPRRRDDAFDERRRCP